MRQQRDSDIATLRKNHESKNVFIFFLVPQCPDTGKSNNNTNIYKKASSFYFYRIFFCFVKQSTLKVMEEVAAENDLAYYDLLLRQSN